MEILLLNGFHTPVQRGPGLEILPKMLSLVPALKGLAAPAVTHQALQVLLTTILTLVQMLE